jgi:hypothetical protein
MSYCERRSQTFNKRKMVKTYKIRHGYQINYSGANWIGLGGILALA